MPDSPASITLSDLALLDDVQLLRMRSVVAAELKQRGLASNVGQMAEILAIAHFGRTAGQPNLQPAPTGTQNVDALSRKGDRYSIKGIMDARKTGTIYPDRNHPDKQLFEYLMIVTMDPEWRLLAIYEFDWKTFCEVRSWDRRMNAWYVGLSARALDRAVRHSPS
jgi:hypothetical protein